MTSAMLTMWRDYEPEIARMPGMLLGAAVPVEPAARFADECFARGARLAELSGTVDLRPGADPRAALRCLTLIRELTANGIVVRWHWCHRDDFQWRPLSHLCPPSGLTAASAASALDWAGAHRAGQLIQRCGPGFLQVRDARGGGSRLLTIRPARYLRAIESMAGGAEAADIPPDVLAALARHQLVMQIGGLAWWLPYRLRGNLLAL